MKNNSDILKKYDAFFVPFSNIPFLYNGRLKDHIRGLSCFAYLIAKHQNKLEILENSLDYLYTHDEFIEELSISSSEVITKRVEQTNEFFNTYFSFLKDISYENSAKLFVFTSFLDGLATYSFKTLSYGKPLASDYVKAFNEIDLFVGNKNISLQEVKKYKKDLIDILSIHKPEIYFNFLFAAS
ncbi:hypothetical protein [Bacillus toyonensis]|uniref:hypothetical protein n=1 Tax=Bacillus toyonensis TaxID=155322 RepID=UPI002E25004C|nr:hypothetical protein [Bacillus toyonensis]